MEIAARMFFPPPQQVTMTHSEPPQKERDSSGAFATLAQSPEEGNLYVSTATGRRLRANMSVTIERHQLGGQRIEIRTNSLGYRNRELAPKAATRILFLGDSITFGDYLHEEETFVRRVELLARAHHDDWETINAGVGSISLQTELAILKETGLSTQPDIVVVGFYLNDFWESPGVYVPRLPFPLNKSWALHYASAMGAFSLARILGGERVAYASFQKLHLRKWKAAFKADTPMADGDWQTDQQAFDALIFNAFDDWGGSWSPSAWEYMSPLFEEFTRISRSSNFRLVLLVFPVRYQVEAAFLNDFPQQELKNVGAHLEFPVLDVLPMLRDAYTRTRQPLFYDQCHHTPYGNELIANAIFEFLASQEAVSSWQSY